MGFEAASQSGAAIPVVLEEATLLVRHRQELKDRLHLEYRFGKMDKGEKGLRR